MDTPDVSPATSGCSHGRFHSISQDGWSSCHDGSRVRIVPEGPQGLREVAFGCIDLSGNPPSFSLTCVGDCVARGCASSGYFADQAVDCFIANIDKCMPISFTCLENACSGPVAACLGSTCPAM